MFPGGRSRSARGNETGRRGGTWVIKRQSGINTTLSWISKGQASSFDMLCLGKGQLCLEKAWFLFAFNKARDFFLTGKVARRKKIQSRDCRKARVDALGNMTY
jgi:hypothetical protein